MNLVRGTLRGVAFLTFSLACVVVNLPAPLLGRGLSRVMRRFWSRGLCRLLNIKVTCEGEPFPDCPTLFVANHVSYLDIIVLGSYLDATFIAKSEVATWPLFGYLSSSVNTFFIKRHWRQALIQRNAMAARMRAGESFVLFAEGTSTNGLAVKPFKTSLMSVAEPWIMDSPVAVQAVTMGYLRLADGTPVDAATCDLYAWHGDMELAPHLWDVLKLEGVQVHIVLHEPQMSWSVRSRKILGRELQGEIALKLATMRGEASPDQQVTAASSAQPPSLALSAGQRAA